LRVTPIRLNQATRSLKLDQSRPDSRMSRTFGEDAREQSAREARAAKPDSFSQAGFSSGNEVADFTAQIA